MILIAFITASHLSPEWNEFYYGDGVGLPEEEIGKMKEYTSKEFETADGILLASSDMLMP